MCRGASGGSRLSTSAGGDPDLELMQGAAGHLDLVPVLFQISWSGDWQTTRPASRH